MARLFTRNIENFTCERCGAAVEGNGFTNHCPACLCSKHVDINPGDRAAARGQCSALGEESEDRMTPWARMVMAGVILAALAACTGPEAELARALQELLGDPARLERMGALAAQAARGMDFGRSAEKVLSSALGLL